MVTTKMSSKGQVVIPKKIREKLQLDSGATFTVNVHEDKIILEPVELTIKRLHGKFKGQSGIDELEKEHQKELKREL